MNNHEHDYIEQCPFCKRYLTALQAKTHNCSTQFAGVKEIPVLYYFEVPDSEDKTIIAHGHDGFMYRLVQCPNPFSHRKPSDDSYHGGLNRRKVTRIGL